MKWKPIKSHPHYQVSDTGLVKKNDGTLIGQWVNHNGYKLVRLSQPRAMFRVHRIVAEAFCAKSDGNVVNHKDFDRANNNAVNLEWCTQWENINHTHKNGRAQKAYWKGKRSPNAKLSDGAVHKIRQDYEAGGVSWETLAKKYNVGKRTIGRIVKNESYR